MSEKAKNSIRQRLEVLGQRVSSPFRSRSRSPSLSTRNAASVAINDLPVGRAAPVSSHRNSQEGVAERESIPSYPPEIGGASNTRPRSTPPPQAVITLPPIIISDGQTVAREKISSLKENPGSQSPNQEEAKSGLELAFDKLSVIQKAVLRGYGLGNDADGDPSERFKQQLQNIQKLGDQCSNEPRELENGKPFLTRGRVYNILRKIEKYAKIGDIAIQHHPDVVALVWASLRMLLQVVLNDLTTFDRLSSSMDDIATLMCSCRRFETLYSEDSGESAQALTKKLPSVYGACLKLIAEALIYVEENTGKRVLKGVTNPFEIRFQPLIEDIQKQQRGLEGTNLPMVLHENVKALCAQQSVDERLAVLEWLSKVKYRDHHDFVKKDRFRGTGKWLLQRDAFDKWLKVESSILWVNGKPGAGKTVLASYIIDTLRNTYHSTPVLFFYCSYKEQERRTAHSMSRTLLKQSLSLEKSLEPGLVKVFQKEKESGHPGTSLSFPETKKYFKAAMLKCGDLFIVIDALDECETAERKEVTTFLGSLLESEEAYRVKILITSRPEDDLCLAFDDQSSYRIDVDDTTEDIEPFVVNQVEELVRSKSLLRGKVLPDLQKEIIDTLNGKADGMFLWVRYQLDGICKQGNSDQVREQLKRLPLNLPDTYKQMWERIKAEGNERIASKALAWLLYAVRPLSPEEIIQAVAVELGSTAFQQHIYPWEHIIAVCGNFVSLDTEQNVLRFEHYSVQEFLKGHHEEFKEAGSDIARTCFTVLSLNEPPPPPDFYDYVATYWQEHAKSWKDTADPTDPIEQFLFDEVPPQSWTRYTEYERSGCQRLLHWLGPLKPEPIHLICHSNLIAILRSFFLRRWQNLGTHRVLSEALALAVRSGCNDIVEFLLTEYPQVDLEIVVKLGESAGTALQFAAFNGSELIAKQLLKANADVNFRREGGSDDCTTALQTAVWKGNENIVQLLLEAGADPNDRREGWGTVLQKAIYQGYESIARHLLMANADVGLRCSVSLLGCTTALQVAVMKQNESVVQLLLEAGADPNDLKEGLGTVLQLAAFKGNELVVKHLLVANADIHLYCEMNIYSKKCYTALQAAVWGDHEKIVQLLLEANADPNDSRENWGSVLQIAAGRGSELIVNHLLEAKADVNLQCKGDFRHCTTALQSAVWADKEEVVKLLLEANANPDDIRQGWGTVLQFAAIQCREPIVKYLLEAKADVNLHCKGYFGGLGFTTALQAATLAQNEKVVQFLLEANADPNDSREGCGTALQLAALKGNGSIVKRLLEANADVNRHCGADFHGIKCTTALQAAVLAQNEQVLQLLLQANADPNNSREGWGTALQTAALKSNGSIVKRLLEANADVNRHCGADFHGIKCTTALQAAVLAQNEQVLQVLLEANADPNNSREGWGTALQIAALTGNEPIVKKLLRANADVNRHCKGDFHGIACTTALQVAVVAQNEKAVQLLLEADADLSDQIEGWGSVLQLAILQGNELIAKYLLEANADPNLHCEGDFGGIKFSTALQMAVLAQNEKPVQLLLEAGADPNEVREGWGTALEIAAFMGSKVIAKHLLGANADINLHCEGDFHGIKCNTALQVAVLAQNEQLVQLFLEAYADPNDSREGWGTVLKIATFGGNELIVKHLLEANADVNLPCEGDFDGMKCDTALQAAVWTDNEKMVQLLLQANADPNESKEGWGTVLQIAAGRGSELIVNYLLKANADVNLHYEGHLGSMSFNTALQVVVFAGNEKMVQILLAAGADPNDIREGLGTILQAAAFKGSELIVKHLLEANADANLHCDRDSDHIKFYTALQAAVWSDNEKIVQLLLEANADPNESREGWGTALEIAAIRGHEPIVNCLLQANADVNLHCEGYFGSMSFNTAIQVAVLAGNAKVVQLLLQAGADPNDSRDGLGTVLQVAAFKGNELVATHLLEANADVNLHFEGSFDGIKCNTALQAAVQGNNGRIVQLLLKYHTDPNASSERCGTALQMAVLKGNASIFNQLLKASADANPDCKAQLDFNDEMRIASNTAYGGQYRHGRAPKRKNQNTKGLRYRTARQA